MPVPSVEIIAKKLIEEVTRIGKNVDTAIIDRKCIKDASGNGISLSQAIELQVFNEYGALNEDVCKEKGITIDSRAITPSSQIDLTIVERIKLDALFSQAAMKILNQYGMNKLLKAGNIEKLQELQDLVAKARQSAEIVLLKSDVELLTALHIDMTTLLAETNKASDPKTANTATVLETLNRHVIIHNLQVGMIKKINAIAVLSVDRPNQELFSLLFLAVLAHNQNVAHALLAKGADPWLPSPIDRTPLDISVVYEDIHKLILKFTKDDIILDTQDPRVPEEPPGREMPAAAGAVSSRPVRSMAEQLQHGIELLKKDIRDGHCGDFGPQVKSLNVTYGFVPDKAFIREMLTHVMAYDDSKDNDKTVKLSRLMQILEYGKKAGLIDTKMMKEMLVQSVKVDNPNNPVVYRQLRQFSAIDNRYITSADLAAVYQTCVKSNIINNRHTMASDVNPENNNTFAQQLRAKEEQPEEKSRSSFRR